MARIAVILGTRPELIKMEAILELLGSDAELLHTGQHYDNNLHQAILGLLGIRPALQLQVGGQPRGAQIGMATAALDQHFADHRPRIVVVHGDTNATLAGALAANARNIPLVHVEAGLRSRDRAMPEEHNRVLVDHLADLCLAPTEGNRQHLLDEGINSARIHVTGSTAVDAVCRWLPPPDEVTRTIAAYGVERNGFVLATFHRPENVDNPEVLAALLDALATAPAPVLLPLHPRTQAVAAHFGLAVDRGSLHILQPVDHPTFLALAEASAVIVSDSGGVQEEASVLKRPLLVIRGSTERPEVIGTFADMVAAGQELRDAIHNRVIDASWWRTELAALPSPYGDGSAAAQCVEAINTLLSGRATSPSYG